MPALPAVPRTLRVNLFFNVGGDLFAQCRIFIQYTGTAPTAPQAAGFATSVRANWNTNFASLYGPGVSLTSVGIIDLNTATGAVGFDNTAVAGTRAGHPNANQVCTQYNFVIARRYRGGKPKIFIPGGMAEDITTGNVWTPAFISSVNAAYAAFLTAILGAGWTGAGTLTQVNVSYYQGFTVVTSPTTGRARNRPTPRGTPLTDAITNSGVEDTPGIQRRRSLGRQ